MKVVNPELFTIGHPSTWEVEQKHVGQQKNRIVIVRNFFKYPDDVKAYAESVDYVSTLQGEYTNLPGYIHYMSTHKRPLYEPMKYICTQFFEGSREIMKTPDESRFGFQIYDVQEKCRYQSLYPHTDEVRYAAVLSFNTEDDYDGDDNGTAFFRSEETGEESTLYDKNYRAKRLLNTVQAKVQFDPSKVKHKEWTKYHVEPHEYNKLIVYEGNLWHSLNFTQTKWNANRMTFNGFIR